MENPFNHHRPVDPAFFLDREEDRQRLRTYIESGRNVLLYGPRRRGKTSLLMRVLRDVEGCMPLYADATTMRNPGDLGDRLLTGLKGTGIAAGRRFVKWLQDRAEELSVTATIGGDGVSVTVRRDHARREAFLDALAFLEEVGRSHDVRFTVCIDEFQTVMADPDLVWAMRSVVQLQKHVNYVLGGSEPTILHTLNADRKSAFYQQLTEFSVQGIRIGEMRRDIEQLFGRPLAPAAQDRIDAACGDNTLRIVQVLRHAWDHGGALDAGAIGHAVEAAIDENSTTYERHVGLLKTENQRRLLFALAETQPRHITGKDFLRSSRLDTPGNVQRAMEALVRLDLVFEGGAFEDPLFREYLVRR